MSNVSDTAVTKPDIEKLNQLQKQVRDMNDQLMDGFTWEYISAETFPGALKLIENYFLKEEVAAVATKITENPKAVEEFFLYCGYIALDGISTVIKDAETKEIVACSFNKLVLSPAHGEHFFDVFGKKYLTQPESKNLVMDFCAITERTNFYETYGLECSIEQVIWNIHPDYRKKKLSFALVIHCIDTVIKMDNGPVSKLTVKDLGPKFSVLEDREITKAPIGAIHAICTSPITQSLSIKYGGIKVDEIFFSEVFYNGKSYEELLQEKKDSSAVLVVFLRRDW